MHKITSACTSENEYRLEDAMIEREMERAKEWAADMSEQVRAKENEDE